jgi:nucleoside-diphosphate-sugar epimerase
MRWVIAGCGYTGEHVARRLLDRRDSVVATVRRPERAAPLSSWLEVHVADDLAAIELGGAVVVDSIPPGEAGFEEGLATRCAEGGARRLIYLSSTGVYGRGDGGWFDEETPPAPLSSRGACRLAAETAILETAALLDLSAAALRIAGIYGPGRGVVDRIRAGGYTVIGPGDTPVCRIHVDDLASAIIAAGEIDALARSIYCIADDLPASSREHADGVAAMLGLPPPGTRDPDTVPPTVRAMMGAGRRISNRRLKDELGLELRYPTWREGARALIESGA